MLSFLTYVLLFFTSCQNEMVEDQNSQSVVKETTIKDGRLSFSSKEEFAKIYVQYADASEDELIKYFQPLYEKGFYSLRPIVNEKTEQFLYNHYLTLIRQKNLRTGRMMKTSGEDIFDYLDDLEDIIGDDAFAAFLNENAEIEIANEIYKYTDVGLFFAESENYSDITEYLDLKNISKDMTVPTSDIVKQTVQNEFPNGGISSVNSTINYFTLAPIDEGGDFGGSGSYTPATGSPASSDPSYIAFIGSIQPCSPHSGLFGNLFGDNNVCIDKYENRRRVKTKAFNYDYLLVYHLGVKVVHQYKGWTGFWRVEATDEIRLVVEAAQFEYNLDKINNLIINNSTPVKTFYFENNKLIYSPNNISITGYSPLYNVGFSYSNLDQSSLPTVFHDGLAFEFFETGWDWLDGEIQNGINSNLNAKKLNEYFYNGLYSSVKSTINSSGNGNYSYYNPPANRTFAAKFPENGKIIIQKSVLTTGNNIGVKERTFDWGFEVGISLSEDHHPAIPGNLLSNPIQQAQPAATAWKIKLETNSSDIIRPRNFRVKIIGAARRGSSWHGSKFRVNID